LRGSSDSFNFSNDSNKEFKDEKSESGMFKELFSTSNKSITKEKGIAGIMGV
jgi:hypothetical protein